MMVLAVYRPTPRHRVEGMVLPVAPRSRTVPDGRFDFAPRHGENKDFLPVRMWRNWQTR
jgi:hypothetical protein